MNAIKWLRIAVILIPTIGLLSANTFAFAEGLCKLDRLNGKYGFLSSGHVINEQTQIPEPYAAGGVLTLNKNGSFAISGTQSLNGVVSPFFPDAGEFTLDDNCKGSATVNGEPFFNFVVTANASQIDFIRTDLSTIITGYAKPMASHCNLANVTGTYGYAFNAIVFNIPLNGAVIPEAFFAGGGTVKLSEEDNAGHAVLDDTASFGGFVIPRHYEGDVTVEDDCTGIAVVTLPPNAPTSANPVNINAVWVDNRKSVMLIQTDPGTFIAGEAKQL